MNYKKIALLASTALVSVALVACGGNNNEKEDTSSKESSSSVEKKESSKESDKKETKKESKKDGSEEFKEFADALQKDMKAKEMNSLYSDFESKDFQKGKLKVTLEGYEILEVKDFGNDYSIQYKDNTDEGGVMIAKYSVENEGDEDIFYSPSLDFSIGSDKRSYRSAKNMIPEDFEDMNSTFVKNKHIVKGKEKITGFYSYSINKEAFDKMKAEGFIDLSIPAAYKQDGFKSEDRIGEDEKVKLAISKDGEKTLTEKNSFYQDKVSTDNWGEKKLLKEKKDINETTNFKGIDFTLNGYQFTEFTPNAEEARSFKDFENGMVLLTVDLSVTNKGETGIDLQISSSFLSVNNGSQRIMNQGSLINNLTKNILAVGEKEEHWLQVYILDQEQYEKIWKDKDFIMDIKVTSEDVSTMTTLTDKILITLPQ